MNHTNDSAWLENKSQSSQSQPMQRVFFSPHPDDIAYSAFGTVSQEPRCSNGRHQVGHRKENNTSDDSDQAGSQRPGLRREDSGIVISSLSCDEVWRSETEKEPRRDLIVTVFSQSRCANGEIGLRLDGDIPKTTAVRTLEDEAFARSVGCDLLQLGFPDSSARDEPSRNPGLAEKAMKMAPDTEPYDFHHYIYGGVRRALEPIVRNAVHSGAQLYLPLGVGCHVDHWMVRMAVLSILDQTDFRFSIGPELKMNSAHRTTYWSSLYQYLVFYEDLPYASAETTGSIEKLAQVILPRGARVQLVLLTELDWHKKVAAVLSYASQMKPTILPSLCEHAVRSLRRGGLDDFLWNRETSEKYVAAERIWIIDPDLREKLRS